MAKLKQLVEGVDFINQQMLSLPSHKEVKYDSLPPHIKQAIPPPVRARAARVQEPTRVAPVQRAPVAVPQDGDNTAEMVRHRLYGDPIRGTKKLRFEHMFRTCRGVIPASEFKRVAIERLEMTPAGFNTYFRTATLDIGNFGVPR